MKKPKIDYVAISLFEIAKQNYKRAEECVNALFEHYGFLRRHYLGFREKNILTG